MTHVTNGYIYFFTMMIYMYIESIKYQVPKYLILEFTDSKVHHPKTKDIKSEVIKHHDQGDPQCLVVDK